MALGSRVFRLPFVLLGETHVITIDVVQVVEAVVFVLGGYLVGVARTKKHYRSRSQQQSIEAKSPLTCEGCGHHFSFHGKQGCNFTWYNRDTASEWVCDCVTFVGMEPAAIGMVSLVPDQDSHNRVKQLDKAKKKDR